MTRGYETTLEPEQGSKRGNANPAYTEDAAHVLTFSAFSQLASLGRVWTGDYTFTGLVDLDFVELFMITGAEPVLVQASIDSAGDAEFWFFEDTLVSADGAAQVSEHFDRNDLSKTLLTQVFIDPTVTADGTELNNALLLGGLRNSATSVGGSSVRALLPNTNYLWRFQNQSGAAQNGTISWAIGE